MATDITDRAIGKQMEHWTSVAWGAHVRHAHVGGRRLCYLDYGEGPALLLVHGLGGSWQAWLENIGALAAEHRVIAVDLPGFGNSDALPPPAEMASHSAALAELIEHLGLERTAVVAHSMGGLIGVRLAVDRPDLVDRLVLVNAGGIRMTAVRLALVVRSFAIFKALVGRPAALRAITRRPRLRRAVLWAMVADPRAVDPRYLAETVPLWAAPGFTGALAAGAREVVRTRPGDVRCPVLLVWGDRDRILPIAAARALAAELPDARLEVIEGVGHCPMFEAADRFNRILLDFTRDAVPAPASG